MAEWGADIESRRALQRLVYRCASNYVLDEAGRLIADHDGDFVRAVIWIALPRPEGGDPARRISIRALARSLDLPFETTRRKLHELADAGQCSLVDGQHPVFLPPDPDRFRQRVDRVCDDFQRLMGQMTRLGVGPDQFLGGQEPPPKVNQPEARLAVHRLVEGFMLRTLEAGAQPYGTMLNALIFAALISANADRITHDPLLARRYAGAEAPPPDELRRPARPAEIAERLSLPYETVRRRLIAFREQDWCSKRGSGYLGSVARMQQPEILATGLAISQRFGQLVQAVSQTGFVLNVEGSADLGE